MNRILTREMQNVVGPAVLAGLVLAGLSFLSWSDYLLFHTIAELFSIVVACCVFIIAWNARGLTETSAIPFLGIAFLCIGILDGIHTLSYKGMPFFPGYGANLPTQMWIAAQYMQSLSLLGFILLMGKRFSLRPFLIGYLGLTAALVALVLAGVFPDCYVSGTGLTKFKIVSEYLISAILLLGIGLMIKRKHLFDHNVYMLFMSSMACSVLAEITFTYYIDVYGLSNLIGHFFKIVSYYLVYKAVVATGLKRPQRLLFRKLKESEERYDSLTHNLYGIVFRTCMDGTLVYIRGAVRTLTGYSEQEFLDQTVTWGDIVFPQDRPAFHDPRVLDALHHRPGYNEHREYRIQHREGSTRWIYESVHNVPGDSGVPAYLEGVVLDITEQKEAEKTAARQAGLLSSLLEAIQESAMLVDENGLVLQANATVARRLGSTVAELVGCPLTDFLPQPAAELVEHNIAKVFASGHPLEFETVRFNRNMHFHLYPVWDSHAERVTGVALLGLDITERKHNELELNKLRRSVENSPMSIVITDTHGSIEYVNPAFCTITGYSHDEAIGQNPKILKSGEHGQDFYVQMWQTITSGQTWRGEMCNRKKDGTLYWEQVAISPVKDEDETISHYVAVKDDISDKKDLERLKADVDRIMHHDLKAPLNGIIGLPQILLMDDNLTSEQRDMVESIEYTGRKMLNMINLSLDLFKMEMGNYTYSPAEVDLLAIISQLLADNQTQITNADLSIDLNVDGQPAEKESSLPVLSEERLLYTLLSNLLINAMEASPPGERIHIDITRHSQVEVCIGNKGAVPEGIRARFFEKYTTYGKKSGTGLGTYSAKLIADALEYDIRLQTSDEQDMTWVQISMPVTAGHAALYAYQEAK